MFKRILITVCCVCFASSAIMGLLLITSERGVWGEFSPDTLEFRVRKEWTFFASGISIHRSGYTVVEHPLLEFLVEEKLVTPVEVDAPKWLQVYHFNTSWRDGFSILYGVMEREQEQAIEWSKENREAAELYWSCVFEYLRSDNPIEVKVGYSLMNGVSWAFFGGTSDVRDTINRLRKERGLQPI